MKFGVIVFPGSNCDDDMVYVLRKVMQQKVVKLWHKETDLEGFDKGDCIIVPGGFSYGDYLRAGAIARFSPIMQAVINFANNGGYVWGICNGFQILCEAQLLSGTLLRNEKQKFICKNIYLSPQTNNAPITATLPVEIPLKIPIAHAEGRYYADEANIKQLTDNDQILFKYCNANGVVDEASNPNGSILNIAGICNANRNVFGMMPHPERASEAVLGNTDGKAMFESLLTAARMEMA
ncbi:MAG: phosphoribosylformylglycinamidine synthase subunit PurQ [Bacteroidota bacterium]